MKKIFALAVLSCAGIAHGAILYDNIGVIPSGGAQPYNIADTPGASFSTGSSSGTLSGLTLVLS